MNQDLPAQTKDLSFDVQQWRRDIQTFAEATSQALDAIIAELSSSCATSIGETTLARADKNSSANLNDPNHVTDAVIAVDSCSDDRLDKLKSQLAKRLSDTI